MAYSTQYLSSIDNKHHVHEVPNLVYDIDNAIKKGYKGQRRFYFSLPDSITMTVLRDLISRYKNAGWRTVAYASNNRLMLSRYVIPVM